MSGLKRHWRPLLVSMIAGLLSAVIAGLPRARGETELVRASEREPIVVTADFSQTWEQNRESVTLLRGRCEVVQGATKFRASKAVLWRKTERNGPTTRERLTLFLEDQVSVEQPSRTVTERTLLTELVTRDRVRIETVRQVTETPADQDPFFVRALRRRNTARHNVVQTQFAAEEPVAESSGEALAPEIQSVELPSPGAVRRVRVFPRSAVRFNVESFESTETAPPEQVFVLSGGINMVIDGVTPMAGTIGLSADRMVIWSQLGSDSDLTGETLQSSDTPMQVYLEGNVVVRQTSGVMRASQAFYDAREKKALLLNAELKAPLMLLPVNARIRAERIRQISEKTYQAQQAWVTTSEFGKPGYRIQSSDVFLEPRPSNPWIGGGEQPIDPATGEPFAEDRLWATTLNNTFLVEDVPLFYVPYLSAPAEDINIPLRSAAVKNDRIFGFQVDTTWDMFKLLGMDRPDDTRWDLQLDYLSKRGARIGTSGNYAGMSRFGLDGRYSGSGSGYFIHDSGLDNLGSDRPSLVPQQPNRGRFLVRDQQTLPYNITEQFEFGFLSDRNYLEQYDEREFDAGKDYESLLYLKQTPDLDLPWGSLDAWSWSAMVRPRLYNYYNETAWLPRGDLYALGQQVFGTPLLWSTHAYMGYADVRIADPPTDPSDKYSVLPWEGNGQSGVFTKRGELALPVSVGPGFITPYWLGEASYWTDNYFTGESLGRFYSSAGARASIEFWKVHPEVRSSIFNLNGLAHKMVFDADYSYSTSDTPLGTTPQYNEFDDNAQEQFRRRLFFNTFNQNVPPQFEPRFYALRTGAAHSVTAPYNELVDTQQVLRLGWRHRLQTKVGPASAPRIKNWMTLDLETSFFPNADRDDFGQPFGLYGARYNWSLSDKTTLTASGYFDTFENAQHLWSVGLVSQRTTRGSVYLGIRTIEGASLRSQIVTATYSYVMSPKWISSVGAAYDIGQNNPLGETITVTRVGSDFLVHLGALVDPLKSNLGFGINIEPRFAPGLGTASGMQMGSLLGGQTPR